MEENAAFEHGGGCSWERSLVGRVEIRMEEGIIRDFGTKRRRDTEGTADKVRFESCVNCN